MASKAKFLMGFMIKAKSSAVRLSFMSSAKKNVNKTKSKFIFGIFI